MKVTLKVEEVELILYALQLVKESQKTPVGIKDEAYILWKKLDAAMRRSNRWTKNIGTTHPEGDCGKQDCQECCEHEFDPDEGYKCLNCRKDGFEDAVAAAEADREER